MGRVSLSGNGSDMGRFYAEYPHIKQDAIAAFRNSDGTFNQANIDAAISFGLTVQIDGYTMRHSSDTSPAPGNYGLTIAGFDGDGAEEGTEIFVRLTGEANKDEWLALNKLLPGSGGPVIRIRTIPDEFFEPTFELPQHLEALNYYIIRMLTGERPWLDLEDFDDDDE